MRAPSLPEDGARSKPRRAARRVPASVTDLPSRPSVAAAGSAICRSGRPRRV
jgi:hypothetical protein